jgi:hypothetical protein
MEVGKVAYWPVATDIAAQANVAVQGNSGRSCWMLQTTRMTHFGHRAVTLSALCRCCAVISKFRGFPESFCRYRQAYRALPEEKDGRRQSLRRSRRNTLIESDCAHREADQSNVAKCVISRPNNAGRRALDRRRRFRRGVWLHRLY